MIALSQPEPQNVEWRFYDYVDATKKNLIWLWLNQEVPRLVKAKFNNNILYLQTSLPDEWRMPLVRRLTGECDGLWEIRTEFQKVQYRVILFREGRNVTLLAGATEKEGKFVPQSTCATAQKRRGEVGISDDRRCEHDYS
jgi:hypothetical protein